MKIGRIPANSLLTEEGQEEKASFSEISVAGFEAPLFYFSEKLVNHLRSVQRKLSKLREGAFEESVARSALGVYLHATFLDTSNTTN